MFMTHAQIIKPPILTLKKESFNLNKFLNLKKKIENLKNPSSIHKCENRTFCFGFLIG